MFEKLNRALCIGSLQCLDCLNDLYKTLLLGAKNGWNDSEPKAIYNHRMESVKHLSFEELQN